MRPTVFRYAAWTILLGSFVILAAFYTSLPSEVIITRGFFGSLDTLAPKSLFTVFRVPLIEVVCALAITLMLSGDEKTQLQADYNAMWNILLFTVAFKSLFQTSETICSQHANLFFYTTLATVMLGLVLAFLPGRRFFASASRPHSKLSGTKKLMLASLLLFYIGLALVPAYVWS